MREQTVSTPTIISNKIMLREKNLSGAQNDYTWETDSELAEFDAAPVVSIIFSDYLTDYTFKLRNPLPSSCHFAIDTLEGQHIGSCSYYNTDEDRGEAELGIMIGNRDCWSKGYGTDAVTALVNYIFQKTNLNRIYLKTLDWNTRAQKCFQKCGFNPCGRLVKDGYRFILMEIHRKQWPEKNSRLEHQL